MTEPNAERVVIQRLHPGDEGRLREIRLRALRDAPEAFVTTFDEGLRLPVERWRDQLQKLSTFVAVRGREGFRRTGKTGALPSPRQHVHDIEMEVELPRRRADIQERDASAGG